VSDVLAQVREVLAEVYTEQGVKVWLESRNRNLGDTAPLDLIHDGLGEFVLREARRVASA
jgi:hypothetical protein